ncbi:MAG TPA: hypothetical protein VF590_14830 [Isosphaeraceae bacterium]|jgi:hypothetical protein
MSTIRAIGELGHEEIRCLAVLGLRVALLIAGTLGWTRLVPGLASLIGGDEHPAD